MFRLNQTIRNLFIRLEGFVSIVLRNFFGFFSQLFSLLSKLLGFSQSEYFVDSDEVQGKKSAKTQELTETESAKATVAPATTRRRPDAKTDDYFLNMAKQVKKS